MTKETRKNESRVGVSGVVEVGVYDSEGVLKRVEEWGSLARDEKYDRLEAVDPDHSDTVENIICIGHHEWATDAMDSTQGSPPPLRTIAVGRDSTTPQESDRSLGDDVYHADIASYEDLGQEIRVATVLDTQEANVDVSAGEELIEMGIVAGGLGNESTFLINHSLLSTGIEKNDSTIATITCTLSWSPA